jgi:hypothetical protein
VTTISGETEGTASVGDGMGVSSAGNAGVAFDAGPLFGRVAGRGVGRGAGVGTAVGAGVGRGVGTGVGGGVFRTHQSSGSPG